MTRFSEIAHDIESQFDPDYDIDPDSGAPPVRYIEHRLLELCETLDARLTALEAKQAPLCKYHHDLWHDLVTPWMPRRGNSRRKDNE